MTLIEALVLGIVQGLTEFVPISSSAHLVLVPELFGWEQPSLPYLVLLHAGTLLALVIYFRRELAALTAGVFRPGPERNLAILLALGTLPAAAIGVAFEKQFEEAFGHPRQVAIQLVVSGLILVAAQALSRRNDRPVDPGSDPAGTEQMSRSLSWRSALGVGFAQALAIIPGISRSGATIAAGLLSGLSRPLAARFSFLLSIPILFGTSVFELPKLSGTDAGPAALLVGFVASAISGYAAIAGMISFLQRRGLLPFAVYCVVVGAVAAWMF
jgi:undecaprenyl-diphosphatase